MNSTHPSPSAHRWQLNIADDSRARFEEIGMHRLWRRPVAHAQNSSPISIWTGWPWQIALDKVERTISQNLFWQYIGRIQWISTTNIIQLNRDMTIKSLNATIYRTEYDMIHLTKFQKEQRIALLNWMKHDCQVRFNICQEQWRTLNLHQPISASKAASQPKWLVGPIASNCLERLRGWIEHIYDQKIYPLSNPELPGQLTSVQACDISVGLKLLVSQLKVRTDELAIEKYIKRINWGRFFVKATIFAPIISLIAKKAFSINVSNWTFIKTGLSGAVVIWFVSYCLYLKEMGRTSFLIACLYELISDLVDRERAVRVEEYDKFNARTQARSSTPNVQHQNSAQSQGADRSQESRINSDNDRQIASERKRLETKSRVETERLKELRAEIEYYEKLHQEFLDEKKIYEDEKKDLLWLRAKVRSMGIQIDYSQGFARLIFPLRIKGPEHQKSAAASQQ